MNEPDGRSVVDIDNPFLPTAVASAAETDSATITILTASMREALGYLDDNLAGATLLAGDGPPARPHNGTVTILGDYGMGKTHLAVALLDRAGRHRPGKVHTVYLDAPADTFVALNRRFFARLRRDEFRDSVARYFTAVVGSRDAAPGPTTRLADSELAFVDQVQFDLALVTSSPAFAIALALLLRPEYESPVWDWLTGHPPIPALVAFGVTPAADVEALAVDAMGVVASVYGRGTDRLVVVLDEADKILSASSRSAGTALTRFARLVEVFAAAGTFLVVVGLPNLLHALDPGTRQRLGPIVRMSPLTAHDVEQFVSETHLRAFGEARLAPFTSDVIRYLTQLADGIPRRIVRMCFHLYQRAVQAQSTVTHAMVRDVVRTYFDLTTMPDVQAQVGRVLNADGWVYQREHVIGARFTVPVTFWVPADVQQAGCAIVLTDSVLKLEEVEDLTRRAAEIRSAAPASETILVVVGHLAAEFAAELTTGFGGEPLVYEPRSFADELSTVVKAAMRRTEEATGADPLTSVRQRVERIHRQQANTQRAVEQLSFQLDDMRLVMDETADVVRGQLPQPNARRSDLDPARYGWPGSAAAAPLPPAARHLLDEARQVVGELTRFDALLRDSFQLVTPEPFPDPGDGTVRLLRSPDALRALGTSVILQRLVEAFQRGVEQWYQRRLTGPDPGDERELDRLCATYDAIAEYLPLFQLEALADLVVIPRDGAEAVESAGTTRPADLRAIFDGLGVRVRRAIR